MKVDVAGLADQREIILAEDWPAEKFDLNAPGWAYATPIHLEAAVMRDAGVISVKLHLKADTALVCSRCGKGWQSPLEKALELVYPFDPSQKTIVLDDDIRGELILSYPQKILCRQNCRGLCSHCGADLNEGACMCKRNEK